MCDEKEEIKRFSLRLNLSDAVDADVNKKIEGLSKQMGISKNELIKKAVLAYENPNNPLTRADISEIAAKCIEQFENKVGVDYVSKPDEKCQQVCEENLFELTDLDFIN